MSEALTAVGPSQAAKLRVIISHGLPLVCAGLLSALQAAPDCEVCVWNESLRQQYGSLRAAGAHVVLSDPDQGFSLLDDTAEPTSAHCSAAPRVIVIATQEQEASLAMQRGIAACLSVQSDQEDIIEAVRSVGAGPSAWPNWKPRSHTPPQGGMAPHALRRVCDYIRDHVAERVDVEVLAQIAKLSASHFSRAFKQSTGLTPHQYLSWRRVKLAARMLRETSIPLIQICHEIGCCDQSHFTRLFSKLMGETPGAYRRRHG